VNKDVCVCVCVCAWYAIIIDDNKVISVKAKAKAKVKTKAKAMDPQSLMFYIASELTILFANCYCTVGDKIGEKRTSKEKYSL